MFLTYAQTSSDCARALEQAEAFFEQGRLLFILERTDGNEVKTFYKCLEGGSFTIDERIRARKLLVKAHLFTDNEEEAEKQLEALLNVDKEHQLTAEDPAELHFLYSKFKTEPILRVAAKFGFHVPNVKVLQSHNTAQVAKDYKSGDVSTPLGLSAEVTVERHIAKGIEVGTGVQLRVLSYGMEGKIVGSELTYDAINQSTMVRFPLLVRYNYNYSAIKDDQRVKLVPYVYVGASFDQVLSADYIDTNRQGGTAFTLPQGDNILTTNGQVNRQNISLMAGVGAKYRIGRAKVNFITIEARYDNSLFNHIDSDTRFVNQDQLFNIGHVEDDLTINAVSVSIGYTHSFYLPRKRKEYR